jgi:hypothetical protein
MATKLRDSSGQPVYANLKTKHQWIQNDIAHYIHRRINDRYVLEKQSSVYAYSGSSFDEDVEEEFQVFVDDEAQQWYWTEEWQRWEAEADEDFRSGRYEDFDSMDDFIASLRGMSGNE